MVESTHDTASAATELVHRMLGDDEAGWSVGTFGAIAEFHHLEGDPPVTPRLAPNGGELVTAPGGMRITLNEAVLPVAFEGLSQRDGTWTHSLVFCLPMSVARLGERTVLTELGPDVGALRDRDRDAVIFDLGLGAPHIDFCVRTADPELVATLRRGAGQSLFAAGNRALAAIKAHDPHRVCLSRLGRVEVYQPIPAAGPGATSPAGPHTHLLPNFLRVGRTHSANTPVPAGWIPAFDLHPRNCFSDRLGQPRAFDRIAFEAFQDVLAMFGPPGYVAEKQRVWDAVRSGVDPSAYRPAATRANRRAARVALRQMRHAEPGATDIEDWLMAFDRGSGACGRAL